MFTTSLGYGTVALCHFLVKVALHRNNLTYLLTITSLLQCFDNGPPDATATPSTLAPVKSRMVYLSGASLPRLSGKKAVKRT